LPIRIQKLRMSSFSKKLWAKEGHREKIVASSKKNWQNPELRKLMLAPHIGAKRSEITKNLISKKALERTKEKGYLDKMMMVHPFRKPVIVEGIRYESARKAAQALKVDQATVMNRIKSLKYPNWNRA
jgi:hypothetical protein